MSRTHKDTRVFKLLNSRPNPDPLQKKYKNKKQDLHCSITDDDCCPKCAAFTNFTKGFLVCTECDWSNFETEELNFETLTFAQAV